MRSSEVLILQKYNRENGYEFVGVFRSRRQLEAFYKKYPWTRDSQEYDISVVEFGDVEEIPAPRKLNRDTRTYWTWIDGVYTDTGEKLSSLDEMSINWSEAMRDRSTPFISAMANKIATGTVEWGFSDD